MSFLTANIDRAIVMTQYGLRGFGHPLGFRIVHRHPKYLSATTSNFVAFAAGRGKTEGGSGTDPQYVSSWEGSFEDHLAMCKRLASDCDESEKEAIRLLISEIVKQGEEMFAAVSAGTLVDNYLGSLSKDSEWGRTIIALAEAFEVALPESTTPAV